MKRTWPAGHQHWWQAVRMRLKHRLAKEGVRIGGKDLHNVYGVELRSSGAYLTVSMRHNAVGVAHGFGRMVEAQPHRFTLPLTENVEAAVNVLHLEWLRYTAEWQAQQSRKRDT